MLNAAALSMLRETGRTFAASVGLALGCAGAAQALTVNITDADPHYLATRAFCGPGDIYMNCRSDTFLDDVTVRFGDQRFDDRFQHSFDAWNATNAAGAKWTLADGGALDGALNVTVFDALALQLVGGVTVRIELDYTGADRDDFVWSQGLFDNYLLDGSIVAGFFEMDIDNACGPPMFPDIFCPPVYPFQYNDERFFDEPRGPWPSAFFEATAMLSKVDYTNRVLTVYEGVSYEFHLSTPEPEAVLLFALGVLGLAGLRVRRRT
jgi:hypothetical protein